MTSRRDLIKTSAGIAVAGMGLRGAAQANASSGLNTLSFEQALLELTGGNTRDAGNDIHLEVPNLVSNGAFVTVTLRSTLSDIDIMHILIDKHPVSHVVSMQPSAAAYLSLSIRIARACQVTALVSTPDGWLRQDAAIENVQIGCEV